MELTDVIAHQGGWDEISFVAVPLLVFAGLLVLAKRRAEVRADVRAEQTAPESVDEP